MPRACSICTHAQHDAIDAALLAGDGYRKIAARFGVAPTSLSRHLRTHLVALLSKRDDVTAAGLLAQVRDLQQQAQAIKDKAEKGGDLRTALQGVRELVRIIELLARLHGDLGDGATVNVLLSPDWLRVRAVVVGALADFPEARAAVARALLEVDGGHGG